MMRIVFVAMAAVLASGVAQAQAVVSSGGKALLWIVVSVREDCSSRTTDVRIIQQPRQGRVTLAHTRGFPNFAPANPRSVCNRQRVQGVAVTYHAPRVFTGQDSVGIGATFYNGEYKSQVYSITVR